MYKKKDVQCTWRWTWIKSFLLYFLGEEKTFAEPKQILTTPPHKFRDLKVQKKEEPYLPNLATLYHSDFSIKKKNKIDDRFGFVLQNGWHSTQPSHVYLLFNSSSCLLTQKKHQENRPPSWSPSLPLHELHSHSWNAWWFHRGKWAMRPWERFRKVVGSKTSCGGWTTTTTHSEKYAASQIWIKNFPKVRGENSQNISVATTQESRGWLVSSPNSVKPNGSFVEFNRHFRTTA